jgi:hypothetical protein
VSSSSALDIYFFTNTVKVLIFAASNFRGFSQLDKFAGTFFRVFLIAQKKKKMYFSANQFIWMVVGKYSFKIVSGDHDLHPRWLP